MMPLLTYVPRTDNKVRSRSAQCLGRVGTRGGAGETRFRMYYFRRVMVVPSSEAAGMAQGHKALFAAMHLSAHLPAASFGVPITQVVEVGLEVEI